MKKLSALLAALLVSAALFAGEFDLKNIPEEYQGTYIPVMLDYKLRETHNFYEAMNLCRDEHDILILGKNICYSNLNFHDSYAINAKDFSQFNYFTNKNGKFILDNNGYSYKMISKENVKNGITTDAYNAYENYVINTIFSEAKELKNIEIKGNQVTISGVTYNVNLDDCFFETKGISIWLYNKTGNYALCIEGLGAKLYQGYRDEEYWETLKSDKVVETIPLFRTDLDEAYKGFIVSTTKEDLRLLHNLVYARHGYVFADKDLQKIFENFKWYKPNPKFTEKDLNTDEKDFLKRLSYYEK